MRPALLRVVAWLAPAVAVQGQDGPKVPTCGGTYSAPVAGVTRKTSCENVAADMKVAVGLQRIVLTTNCGVRIHCKSGASFSSSELQGTTVSNGLFKRALPSDSPQFDQIFDPRVIYDDSDPSQRRFWIVATENAYSNQTSQYSGKIHIAVSKSETPANFLPTGVDGWYKYTSDGTGCAGSAISLPSLANPPAGGWFADRPSVTVDDVYIYIVFKVLAPAAPSAFFDTYSVAMVFEKAVFLAGGPTPTLAHWQTVDEFDGPDGEKTWGHEFFVDRTVEAGGIGGVHKVYMVTVPDVADGWASGDERDYLRFGAIWLDGTWKYKGRDIVLPTEAKFRRVESSAPGGGTGTCEGGADDCNALAFSLFWNGVTRTDGVTRYLWTIHDIRPLLDPQHPDTDRPSQLQVLSVDPMGFPAADPVFLPTVRHAIAPAWAHDGSIDVNSCGDWAVSYTRSELNHYPAFYSWTRTSGGTESDTKIMDGADNEYLAGGSWADYSGTANDPSNAQYFWGHSMVVFKDPSPPSSDQWQSWLPRYTVGNCQGGRPNDDFDQGLSLADLNGDGTVSPLDLTLIADAVQGGRGIPDANRDGTGDYFDILWVLDQIRGNP